MDRQTDGQTDGHTYIWTCRAASLQLKIKHTYPFLGEANKNILQLETVTFPLGNTKLNIPLLRLIKMCMNQVWCKNKTKYFRLQLTDEIS